MSYTITLSGPQGQYKAALKAVKAAGYQIVVNENGEADPTDSRGLAHGTETEWTGLRTDDGDVIHGTGEIRAKKSAKPICFITCIGTDRNAAAQAVESLRWVDRACHETPEPEKPLTPAEKLRRLGLTPADLKALVS